MNRFTLTLAGAVAACAAAVPAVLGLSGNPSFSQHIPVPVPSHAHLVQFDDSGQAVADSRKSVSPSSSAHRSGREVEPGDDRGSRSREPGDDHGGLRTTSSHEPGDDRSTSHEPGDDRGGRRSSGPTSTSHAPSSTAPVSSTSSEPGDDRGRHGGSSGSSSSSSGSDDHGRHGGSGSDDR